MSRLHTSPELILDLCFDADSVQLIKSQILREESAARPGDEVVTGIGTIGQRAAAAIIHNPSVNKGYLSTAGSNKIVQLMDHAEQMGVPILSFLSSPGITLNEGPHSGDGYSRVLRRSSELKGQILQIGVVAGVCIGAPAYSVALQDLTIFNRSRSYVMVSPPMVVERALGESATLKDLGGSELHATVTGMAHFVVASLDEQIQTLKSLMGFFPGNFIDEPMLKSIGQPKNSWPSIPVNGARSFDVNEVLSALFDSSSSIEFASGFGTSVVCSWGHVGGFPVGVIANQSLQLAGSLTVHSTEKIVRFVKLCNQYSIPILTLVDTPGFMPGLDQERNGLLKIGAELCQALQTRVPRIGVLVRKSYGAAALLLGNGKNWGGDFVVALDSAQGAPMSEQLMSEITTSKETISDLLAEPIDAEYLMREQLVDEVVKGEELRNTLIRILGYCQLRRDKK